MKKKVTDFICGLWCKKADEDCKPKNHTCSENQWFYTEFYERVSCDLLYLSIDLWGVYEVRGWGGGGGRGYDHVVSLRWRRGSCCLRSLSVVVVVESAWHSARSSVIKQSGAGSMPDAPLPTILLPSSSFSLLLLCHPSISAYSDKIQSNSTLSLCVSFPVRPHLPVFLCEWTCVCVCLSPSIERQSRGRGLQGARWCMWSLCKHRLRAINADITEVTEGRCCVVVAVGELCVCRCVTLF